MFNSQYKQSHYITTQQKQCRRLVFRNQDEIQKVFCVNISKYSQYGLINIIKILFHLEQRGLLITDQVFHLLGSKIIVDPRRQMEISPQFFRSKKIIFQSQRISSPFLQLQSQKHYNLTNSEAHPENIFFSSSIDLLEQSKFQVSNIESQEIDQDLIQKQKRFKNPQRNIKEVIIALKKWRKLSSQKKINLPNSAKLIGISKKSLDDYYAVLRRGQSLGFDFQDNLDKKMGDLRSYIRSAQNNQKRKLPKQLKCLNLVPDFDDIDLIN